MDCDPPFRASLVGLPSPAAGPCWSPDELAPPVPRGAGGRWGRTRMAELTCGHGTQWPPDERDRVGRGSHTLWAESEGAPTRCRSMGAPHESPPAPSGYGADTRGSGFLLLLPAARETRNPTLPAHHAGASQHPLPGHQAGGGHRGAF